MGIGWVIQIAKPVVRPESQLPVLEDIRLFVSHTARFEEGSPQPLNAGYLRRSRSA
jgi:hypothetical protein